MDTSLCGQPGRLEASSLCWRSVYSFAINAILKINVWYSLPRGLYFTGSVNIHHWWPRVLAYLGSIKWDAWIGSEAANGGGGQVHQGPGQDFLRRVSPLVPKDPQQGQSSGGCNLAVFSHFSGFSLISTSSWARWKIHLVPFWSLEFTL